MSSRVNLVATGTGWRPGLPTWILRRAGGIRSSCCAARQRGGRISSAWLALWPIGSATTSPLQSPVSNRAEYMTEPRLSWPPVVRPAPAAPALALVGLAARVQARPGRTAHAHRCAVENPVESAEQAARGRRACRVEEMVGAGFAWLLAFLPHIIDDRAVPVPERMDVGIMRAGTRQSGLEAAIFGGHEELVAGAAGGPIALLPSPLYVPK